MNYAIIGCGRIAKSHILSAQYNNLKIVALCDSTLHKAEKLKSEMGLTNVSLFSNHEELLNSISLDLVSIATPNENHSQIALDFIRKGVNVIIEKPFTLNKIGYSELLEARDRTGVKVAVCHQNRFNKSIQRVKEAIDNGHLGNINYISAKVFWYRDNQYYEQDVWRGSQKNLDGALMNQSIHNIDLLLWLMKSSVVSVKSLSRNFIHPEIEMEDFGAALIEFDSGAVGFFEATTATVPSNLEETLYIIGDNGTIKVGGQSVNQIEEWRVKGGVESAEEIKIKYSENPENVYGFGHRALYRDMIEAIEQNREPYVTLEEGFKAVELILEIYGKQ